MHKLTKTLPQLFHLLWLGSKRTNILQCIITKNIAVMWIGHTLASNSFDRGYVLLPVRWQVSCLPCERQGFESRLMHFICWKYRQFKMKFTMYILCINSNIELDNVNINACFIGIFSLEKLPIPALVLSKVFFIFQSFFAFVVDSITR